MKGEKANVKTIANLFVQWIKLCDGTVNESSIPWLIQQRLANNASDFAKTNHKPVLQEVSKQLSLRAQSKMAAMAKHKGKQSMSNSSAAVAEEETGTLHSLCACISINSTLNQQSASCVYPSM